MNGVIALSDPTRRRIIEMLAQGEMAAGEIVARFALSAPAISQHLRALREARLVRVRIAAQRRIYALDPAGFAELQRWLARVAPRREVGPGAGESPLVSGVLPP